MQPLKSRQGHEACEPDTGCAQCLTADGLAAPFLPLAGVCNPVSYGIYHSHAHLNPLPAGFAYQTPNSFGGLPFGVSFNGLSPAGRQ